MFDRCTEQSDSNVEQSYMATSRLKPKIEQDQDHSDQLLESIGPNYSRAVLSSYTMLMG
jgi:hypothetical protein